jgi:small-conductance mechanosensitive channel
MENIEQVKVRDLFTETKKVLAEYKKKAEQLDQQDRELYAELYVLQEEMTSNMLAQEGATASEMVYLKMEAKYINQKTDIIKVLLEELVEERTALKLKFTPIYRDAIRKDGANLNGYDAVEIAERYRYEMLKEISDIGVQMQRQYNEIAPDIYELFEDSKVKEEYPRLEYSFNAERYTPSFGWFGDSCICQH